MATRRQLGGISREFFSIPVTCRRHPDNEQKNREQFAPKNGQKPKPSGVAGIHVFSSQERAETIPRGGQFFFGAAIDAWLGVLSFRSQAREVPKHRVSKRLKVCPQRLSGLATAGRACGKREEPVDDTREPSYSNIDRVIWAVVVIGIVGIGWLIVSNL